MRARLADDGRSVGLSKIFWVNLPTSIVIHYKSTRQLNGDRTSALAVVSKILGEFKKSCTLTPFPQVGTAKCLVHSIKQGGRDANVRIRNQLHVKPLALIER